MIQVGPETAQQAFDTGTAIKRSLRRIETLGKPVVAAINGAALGGGYEIALACHHRVALDAPGSKIGLPEVTLGLLPAGGGVTRTVRLLGIADALLKVLLQGTQYSPQRALENGLVHEVAATPEEMLAKARAFIDAHPESQQPWDVKGYKIPGGTPSNPRFAANLPAFPANLKKQLQGAPYPAPRNILAAAVEGSQVDFETALTIEARYFTELATGQTSKNMIQAFFFDLQAVNSGASRPRGDRAAPGPQGRGPRRRDDGRGHRVLLRAGRHRRRPEGRVARSRRRRARRTPRSSSPRRSPVAVRRRRSATSCSPASRRPPTRRRWRAATRSSRRSSRTPRSSTRCSRRSRTSSSPTRCCAPTPRRCRSPSSPKASRGQADFIGLHFFSPVDKMPLVEIIKGEPHRRRGAGPRLRPGAPDQQDADRRERLARLLHLAGHRPLHQRGRRDGRRGHRARVHRAGGGPGRLPGQGPVPHGRADADPAAQDPQRDEARRRGSGRHLARPPLGRGHRPDGRRVRPHRPKRRRGLLRVRRGRQAGGGCGRACASTSASRGTRSRSRT